MLVGALRVALEHAARPRAVQRARSARGRVQAHVGLERRAHRGNVLAEHRARMAAQRIDQRGVARVRLQCASQQHAPDVHAHARDAGGGVGDDLAYRGFDVRGVMRRSSFSTTLPGTTFVFVPPAMSPTFTYGWSMPATPERMPL